MKKISFIGGVFVFLAVIFWFATHEIITVEGNIGGGSFNARSALSVQIPAIPKSSTAERDKHTNAILDDIKEYCKKLNGAQLEAITNAVHVGQGNVPSNLGARGQNSTTAKKDCGEGDRGRTLSTPRPPQEEPAKESGEGASNAFETLLDEILEGQDPCYRLQEIKNPSGSGYAIASAECEREAEKAFAQKIKDIHEKLALDESKKVWYDKNFVSEESYQQVVNEKIQNCQMRQIFDEIAAKPLCP